MPTRAATPAQAAAERVAAPIIAGTTPAIVVPAIISPAEDELGLFHVSRDCHRREAIDGQSAGLTDRA
jgi:hypothetical protein